MAWAGLSAPAQTWCGGSLLWVDVSCWVGPLGGSGVSADVPSGVAAAVVDAQGGECNVPPWSSSGAGPMCGDGKEDCPAPRSRGPPPSASCPHMLQQWASWEGAGAPGAAWERVALRVCHSYLGQRGSGSGILSCGHFTNTVVLHRNSLGLPEPRGKSQPCKLGHEQLKV